MKEGGRRVRREMKSTSKGKSQSQSKCESKSEREDKISGEEEAEAARRRRRRPGEINIAQLSVCRRNSPLLRLVLFCFVLWCLERACAL